VLQISRGGRKANERGAKHDRGGRGAGGYPLVQLRLTGAPLGSLLTLLVVAVAEVKRPPVALDTLRIVDVLARDGRGVSPSGRGGASGDEGSDQE
jgi:hypothetical protein